MNTPPLSPPPTARHAACRRWLLPCALLAVWLALAACSSAPPAPDWQINTHNALQRASQAWLQGNSRIADLEFETARREASATGRADIMARVELTRCAVLMAALDMEPCTAFFPLQEDAGAAANAYARYLQGNLSTEDVAALPAAHRAIATLIVTHAGENSAQEKSASSNAAALLENIDDPLARQIAAAALLRVALADADVMRIATDTASSQGWRRPLLAWLILQRNRAEQSGDTAELMRLQRRLDILMRAMQIPSAETPPAVAD